MKYIRRLVLLILLAMVITVFVPVKASAQVTIDGDEFSKMSGLMINTTAGTINEGDWRLEGYSALLIGNVFSESFGSLIDGFIESMGASVLYGLSRNTEMCINIDSFDNIFGGSSINLPNVQLNCKVNLMPKYESTGLGFVIQLLNFSGNSITYNTDLFVVATGIIKEAVLISVQAGLMQNDIRAAILTSPRETTNLMLEIRHQPGGGSINYLPGSQIRFFGKGIPG